MSKLHVYVCIIFSRKVDKYQEFVWVYMIDLYELNLLSPALSKTRIQIYIEFLKKKHHYTLNYCIKIVAK